MQKSKNYIVYLACLMMTPVLLANDEITSHILEVSPSFGYFKFDDDRGIEDAYMGGIALGVYFTRRWALMLQFQSLNTTLESPAGSRHVDVENFHVDAQRFFNTEKNLRPYVVVGAGRMAFVAGKNKTIENIVNLGLGLDYKIAPAWFLRSDVRVYDSFEDNHIDNTLMIRLGYRLNGGER